MFNSNINQMPDETTLDELLEYAAGHNPALRGAVHRRRAAEQVPAQARALPDPSLNVGYESMDRESRIGVSQMFPLWGKRELRGRAAREVTRAEGRRVEAEALAVFSRVAGAYADYVFVERSLAVVQENLGLARQLEEVALARFRAGDAPHADVIRAEIELGRMEDELATMQQMLTASGARLNSAIGRASDAPLPRLTGLPVDPDRQGRAWEEGEVLELVRQANPELAAMRHEVEAARRETQLARREYYPDLMVGADYMRNREMGEDGFGVMVSINLPLWRGRLRAGVREANERFYAAAAEQVDLGNRLEADAQMALFAYRDATRKVALYRDRLIPQAQQGLAASEAAYRAGAVTFADLIESNRLLLEFELSLARALADQLTAEFELEMLTGRRLRE